MKKILHTLSLAAAAILLLGSCAKINERIDNLEGRINGLKSEEIASISTQITSITSSIADLGTIRTNIQNLTATTAAQAQDIKDLNNEDTEIGKKISDLKKADESIGSRIDDLQKYVNDTLKSYGTKEWVEATFSTLAQYEATCDTIAKIDARIGDLDSRLSQSIEDCADSLKSWVNVQLDGYYTIAQMDAKVAEMNAQIDTLRGENEAKADSLKTEIVAAKAELDTVKANIRTEYKAAIETAITELDGKLSNELQTQITQVNAEILYLDNRISSLALSVLALSGKVTALEAMIQSVVIVPAYSDGSVKIESDSLHIDCIVSPDTVVKKLTKENISILINKVKTKAFAGVDTVKLGNGDIFERDETNGTFSIRVNIENQIPSADDSTITVAVNVKNGISNYTSKFVSLIDGSAIAVDVTQSNGDYILPAYKKVILNFNGVDNLNTTDTINLKYDENKQIPTKLYLRVAPGKYINVKGNLPNTTVIFDKGSISTAKLTTAANTFKIISPAKIIDKIVVTGGNVEIKSPDVKNIEVAAGAVADTETKAPVMIKVAGSGKIAEKITTSANVIVENNNKQNDITVEIPTEAQQDVKVAAEGEGKVKDTNNQEITTTSAARIDDALYFTLKDAITAAKDRDVLTVTATEIEAIQVKEQNKTFTIDLNGNTVTVKGPAVGSEGTENQAFQLLKGNTVTIKNGTLKCDNTNDSFCYIIQNYCNLTLEDVTIDGSNLKQDGKAYAYTVSNNYGNIEFKGSTSIIASTATGIDTYAFYSYRNTSYDAAPDVIWNSTGTVTGRIELNGGNLVLEKNLTVSTPIVVTGKSSLTVNSILTCPDATSIIVQKEGELTINGSGSIKGSSSAVDIRGGSLNITGGTFSGTTYALYEKSSQVDASANVSISVTGGILNGQIYSENCTGFISGGTFSKKPDEKYIKIPYVVKQVGNMWTVDMSGNIPAGTVALCNDVPYSSLQLAFNAVQDGVPAAIDLIDDATTATLGDKNNVGAKTVILNLNGHSISGVTKGITALSNSSSLEGATIVNFANLTISGNGQVGDLEANQAIFNYSIGTSLVINGGTYITKGACIFHYGVSSANQNTASITINGGKFESTPTAYNNTRAIGLRTTGTDAQTLNVVVNGGEFKGTYGMYIGHRGTMLINDAKLYGTCNAIIGSMNKNLIVDITGGTFETEDTPGHENNYKSTGTYTGSSLPIYIPSFGCENVVFNISGGTFKYPYLSWQSSGTIPSNWERAINAGNGITSNVENKVLVANLTGGTYSTDQTKTIDGKTNTELVHDGYQCVKNNDGTWTITKQ